MSYLIHTYRGPEELPDYLFNGYIWLSDQELPQEISSKKELMLKGKNPFIVEGFLLNQDRTRSFTFSNQNGQLVIYEYDLDAIYKADDSILSNHSFLTHRLENHSKINFITVWLPWKDPICEEMEVLKPMMRVFNGFE